MTAQVDAATQATAEVVTPDAKPETKVETIAEIIGDKEPKNEPKVVPEAAFLELKNANKELKRELKALSQRIEQGATSGEVSSSIDEIAKEYEVDPKFLGKFAAAIRKDAEAEAEKKVADRLKPFEERDRAEKIQKVFSTHFDKAMMEMEDYKGIVNKDAIFALSLNPSNASKTIPQLIEETYGSAISGKRSIETTQPRSGASAGEFDPERANRDAAYLKEVFKDPVLRKSYDAWKQAQGRS